MQWNELSFSCEQVAKKLLTNCKDEILALEIVAFEWLKLKIEFGVL